MAGDFTLDLSLQVGKYDVQKLLGKGATGTVYLAKDTFSGREVALKTIEPEEVMRKTGYSRPHTVHCGPEGIYISTLGGGGKAALIALKMWVEDVNAKGGLLGRKVDLLAEDSVNPQTASTKAVEGMILTTQLP